MKKRKYLQRISLLLGCLFIFNLAYPATADAADALRTVLACLLYTSGYLPANTRCNNKNRR